MTTANSDLNRRSSFLSALVVILLAVAVGVIIELHPFVHPGKAGPAVHYILLAFPALYLGWVLYAGWKGRNLWASDDAVSPGQFLTVGYAALTLHMLAFDIASYILFQCDRGVPRFEHLTKAWMLLGYLWLALPLFWSFRRKALVVAWRYHALLGSLLFGFQACLGLIESITYAMALIDRSYGSEDSGNGVMAILSGGADFLLLGWFCVLFLLYVRDYFQGTRYRWLHYVPILCVIVIIAIGIVTCVQFLSDRL